MTGDAQKAGRGALYITAAKGYFLLSGALLVLGLPRLFGSDGVGLYGKFSLVMGALAVLNMIMITGALQASSRFAAQAPAEPKRVLRPMLKVQALLGIGLYVMLFFGSPALSRWLGDPDLTPYFRLGGLVTLGYSFYAVFIGVLNGQKRFGLQASFDIGFATLKVSSILLLTLLGFGVMGAVAGFVGTVAVFLTLSAWAATKPVESDGQSTQTHAPGLTINDVFKFIFPVLAYALFLNLLLQTDLFLVKKLLGEASDYSQAGVYSAAVNLARLPYQATMAITLVLFPFVSSAAQAGDGEALGRTISQAIRYALLGSGLFAAPLFAAAPAMVGLIFPPGYEAASPALQILSLGYMALTLLGVGMAALNAAGRPWLTLAVAGFTLLLDALLNSVLIPKYGLPGAGVATTGAYLSGATCILLLLALRFKTSFPIKTLARIIAALAASYLVALPFSPDSMVMRLVVLVLAGLALPVTLLVLGEFNRQDRERLRALLPGK